MKPENKFQLSMLKRYRWWTSVLGALVGGISLFGLSHSILELGISYAFELVLAVPRAITEFLVGWIPWLLQITVPDFFYDIWTLSFLGGGAAFRSNGLEPIRQDGDRKTFDNSMYSVHLLIVLFSLIGAGYFFILYALFALNPYNGEQGRYEPDSGYRYRMRLKADFRDSQKSLRIEVFAAVVICFVFSALNSVIM